MFQIKPPYRVGMACLAAIAGLMLSPAGPVAQEQTIDNVASASWEAPVGRDTIDSNVVSFTINPEVAQLTTFAPLPGSPETVLLRNSYCQETATALTISTQSVANIATTSTSITPTSTIRVGQNLVIRIDSAGANINAVVVDQLNLQLETPSGDFEKLVAIENSPNSGVFYAQIRTIPLSPPVVHGDCFLSLAAEEMIDIEAFANGQSTPFLLGEAEALADPFGVVFDSLNGQPVDGTQVTIIDTATGQPAQVFALDGITPYPSTVITGTSATDASGLILNFVPGEYRFPLVPLGNYRLVLLPPQAYTAPSTVSEQELALLRNSAGEQFSISAGSFGEPFTINSTLPVQIDIPVDFSGPLISINKRASRELVEPGDAVFYTVTLRNTDRSLSSGPLTLSDTASFGLRLRSNSVRVDGSPPDTALVPSSDGRGFTLALTPLPPGGTLRITYAMTVRDDAPVGDAPNSAIIYTTGGNRAEAVANVRIQRDDLTARMTVVGRVVDGTCGRPEDARGIPGVRVMMEDGSFAITDADGRYHFEGVVPGSHVLQAARTTLPEGGEFIDCVLSSRSAGSGISRFVSGQGGSLAHADFHATLPEGTELQGRLVPQREGLDAIAASGAEIDFVAMGDGPDGFLFPAVDHNPRSPSVRVAIRHRANHSVSLVVDGMPVDPLAFDGTRTSADQRYAVSIWRGIPLEGSRTSLHAEIQDAAGDVVESFERQVSYATTPLYVEIVAESSQLIADGATSPVLAVRMLDRNRQPVHAGISGTLSLESPYQTVSAFEAQQSRELSGFGNSAASWTVRGDDGIAYIDLAPTMVSGALRATFNFTDGDTTREQQIESWIEPGDQPWTLIGLAEGSVGARSVAEHMERDGNFDSDLGENARIAFYAKGRVLGEYLLTIAYDSAKQEADQRVLGAIDPAAYYTVFADSSQRLFDAASRDNIYIRIENSSFYALYGDFDTGFDQTELARYQRTVTGVRGEAVIGQVQVEGFGTHVGSQHRHEEFQGDGTSGPYRLATRRIVPNSGIVYLEVRDRFRSEIIISRQELTRFVDYDIDLLSGTISFAQPILSRDAALNPRFVVVDYDADSLGSQEWNGGVSIAWTSNDGTVRIGATGLTDKGDEERTNLGAIDVTVQLGESTEFRAEVAVSESGGIRSTAYLAEMEHFSGSFDFTAYARQVDAEYGVGQQNLAERGQRKFGIDGRIRLSEEITVAGSTWHNESLTDAASRDAGELRAVWQTSTTDAFIGIAHFTDTLVDGRKGDSTVLQLGGAHRLWDNNLELTAASSVPLGGTDSIDLPTRHSLGMRYSVSNDIRLIGTYEIARGDTIDANSVKFGAEVTPFEGATLIGSLGNERIGGSLLASDEQRQFAAVTVGYTFRIGEHLLIDATIDGNKTLGGGISPTDIINVGQPVSSGGQFGTGGSLGEDFTAVTLGAAWSAGSWSARLRGELRDGEFANRTGFDLAAIRRLGEGSVIGSGVTWTRAETELGGTTETMDAAISVSHRPDRSAFAFLGKLEYRSDEVSGAIAGEVGSAGRTALLVTGDARSRRLIASISTNWAQQDDEDSSSRTEVAVFTAVRHNFDQLEDFDLAGTNLLGGLDLRIGIGERFEVGGRATVRHDLEDGTTSFAFGPEIGFVPANNVIVSVGYNVVGFRDPDFSEARTTNRGLFATLRMKFDDDTFSFLRASR